jgi:ABC-type Zn uptake system ZnuABC Zn-binding protein ZnuA
MIKKKELFGALARGYCHPKNSHKVLDPNLLFAMAKEVQDILKKKRKK